ncbi:hypothetical protein GOP47_0008808 [Adiantum capillus-veneris]|uniref:Uncharacterized protein n=1 Tax=Adiantum capillus-veneris TaxID=13818 RepID=A0A9D4UZZ8_ADICA|nr:hypothetical protein GOP47_0008808 [Adiantum capillus-veneris]
MNGANWLQAACVMSRDELGHQRKAGTSNGLQIVDRRDEAMLGEEGWLLNTATMPQQGCG